MSLEALNDNHLDLFYEATVQAIEEAILNAMIAAESRDTIKPAGKVVRAIDHVELMKLLQSEQQ